MATTYRDYLWFHNDDQFGGWCSNGHVVSLIRDATAAAVLEDLRAYGGRRSGTGFTEFSKRAFEFELLDLRPTMSDAVQTVGVAELDDGWVLLVQQNSDYVGISDELFAPVIKRHEVVSHYSNVNAVSRFVWWKDGTQQVSFEPMFPSWDLDPDRATPSPGAAVVRDLITEVGGIDLEETEEPRSEFFHIEGSFALAERLTGIAVDKHLLETAEFTVALVPTTSEPQAQYAHELPPRVPLLGADATWQEVYQLYRSSAEATVHATMVLSTNQSGSDEHQQVEFWYSPHAGTRQVDAHGLLSVDGPDGHWDRGPYVPDTQPDRLLMIHRRWGDQTPFRLLIDPANPGTAVDVNGRRAWEFVFPPEFFGGPIAVAFDAHTGVALRAETNNRTEELVNPNLDDQFDEDLFTLPD